ncbi:unnamed protein product [Haemonchus placei]|uniref:Uncharacterized protein n=1 Tax=Haemonchus placei TaxID=6290 RepID=A0A0N4VT56_HAEPC|nr:unnamed protein product [Haemonchus placei]
MKKSGYRAGGRPGIRLTSRLTSCDIVMNAGPVHNHPGPTFTTILHDVPCLSGFRFLGVFNGIPHLRSSTELGTPHFLLHLRV